MSEERLKIAVFIDFDNIEIGVKKTLSRHFDVGAVLEAIKERGEVVTKIAYGDWKHAADYSRALTQHAVQMVQRNLTPGGDKNGADITLALDALEMAFTRSHINAFVIVGGDSDFIALVEKLKQYDKMVFVVGGRSFTSSILQKNCHEFIAYENLIGIQPAVRKTAGKAPSVSTAPLRDALPPLRRAMEVLADREVSPQLGLLKSTLLQLDSTFSERDYGAHSFREFIQKLANAGFVNLKQVDRSLVVELKDGETAPPAAAPTPPAPPPSWAAPVSGKPEAEPAPPPAEPAGPVPDTAAAVAVVRGILEQGGAKPHWPMYLRSFKHFLKAADPSFDEHSFGYASIHDLARQAQREGLLRIERNRQGILRIFPGEQLTQTAAEKSLVEEEPGAEVRAVSEAVATDVMETPPPAPDMPAEPIVETIAEPGVILPQEEPMPVAEPVEKPRRRRTASASSAPRTRKPTARRPRTHRKSSEPQ